MTVSGTWNLTISTPLGSQSATLDLVDDGADVSGTATSGAESVALAQVTRAGSRLVWDQKISKPFPMTVTFDVLVDGDTLSGKAKPGLFPASDVVGHRS